MTCDAIPHLRRLQELAAENPDPDFLGRAVVEIVAEAMPQASWTGIYWLEGQTLRLGPYIGAPTEHASIPVGIGVCGTAAAHDEDQVIEDVRAIDNYLSCSAHVRSELVVLIRSHGETVGQIDLDAEAVGAFSEEDHCVVKAIADSFGALLPPRIG